MYEFKHSFAGDSEVRYSAAIGSACLPLNQ
jgi:hypothetical protein